MQYFTQPLFTLLVIFSVNISSQNVTEKGVASIVLDRATCRDGKPIDRKKQIEAVEKAKKSAWEKVGGFKNYKGARSNMLGVDNMIHKDLEAHGLKTMVMNGVYVYHWYRGGDSFNTSHLI